MVRRERRYEPCEAGESEDSANKLPTAEIEKKEFIRAAVGIGCPYDSGYFHFREH